MLSLTSYSVQAQKGKQIKEKAQIEKLHKTQKDTLLKKGKAKKEKLNKNLRKREHKHKNKLSKEKKELRGDIEKKGNAYGKDKSLKAKNLAKKWLAKLNLKKRRN